MLNVVMLSVGMLNVVAPERREERGERERERERKTINKEEGES